MWWRRSATCSRRPKLRKRSKSAQGSGFWAVGKSPNPEPSVQSRKGFSMRFRLMRVYGSSMLPTLRAGQLVFVDAHAYAVRAPHRGEVVAVTPRVLGGKALVKRLIGLPHDQVDVNGRRWQLGPDQFFLLGDQSDESVDSRRFGPVSREELVGPVRCGSRSRYVPVLPLSV